MQAEYGVAAFRSRQQVMRFESRLRRMGVAAQVVSTPRNIAMGCGLSVRFALEDAPSVRRALAAEPTGSLIGVYRAHYDGARVNVRPLRP